MFSILAASKLWRQCEIAMRRIFFSFETIKDFSRCVKSTIWQFNEFEQTKAIIFFFFRGNSFAYIQRKCRRHVGLMSFSDSYICYKWHLIFLPYQPITLNYYLSNGNGDEHRKTNGHRSAFSASVAPSTAIYTLRLVSECTVSTSSESVLFVVTNEPQLIESHRHDHESANFKLNIRIDVWNMTPRYIDTTTAIRHAPSLHINQ